MNFGVIGLGMLGGSVSLSLTGRGHRVLGCDTRAETVSQAIGRGAIEGPLDLAAAADFDALVLAAPPKANLTWLEELASGPAPRLILDVSSVKGPLVARGAELHLPFVGGHPLCGTEGSGLDDASAHLFSGAPFFLVAACATGAHLAAAESLVRELGAHPVWVEAGAHDRFVAMTSHLPWMLARALLDLGGEVLPEGAGFGPAFRSLTRPGHSPEALWREILTLNAPQVRAAWAQLSRRIEERMEEWIDDEA